MADESTHHAEILTKLDSIERALQGDDYSDRKGLIQEVREVKARVRALEDQVPNAAEVKRNTEMRRNAETFLRAARWAGPTALGAGLVEAMRRVFLG